MVSCPVRLNIGLMLAVLCFLSYMLRANIAIGLLAMVKTNGTDPNYGPRYEWTPIEVSYVQGSFFAGSCVSTFPAGFLAEWFGAKFVTTIALIISLILTALSPLVSQISVWVLIIDRFFLGIVGGIYFPACHSLVSKWAPTDEKGKFVASLLGGNLGTVVTFLLGGILTEAHGWEMVFYGQAILIVIIIIGWITLVSDRPRTHRFISQEEVEYIEKSLGPNISTKKKVPPYGKIFTSVPFISLILLHYGNLWGLFFLLTVAPDYMNYSLDFDMKKSGLYSSLPHLARFLAGFIFGWIGDYLRRRSTNPTFVRKIFCIFSHIIPGILLLMVPYINNTSIIISCLTISLGFNGAATLTNLQNCQDLGPNHAGTLYSIINFIGLSSGFFGPLLKGKLVELGPIYDFNPWSVMFVIGGLGYIIPAFVFWFAGTAEIQKWNEYRKKNDVVI